MAFKNFSTNRRGPSIVDLMREAIREKLPVHAAVARVRRISRRIGQRQLARLYADLKAETTSPLGDTAPDEASKLLGTRYDRFSSPTGIDGLARETDGRLDLLAVAAREPGQGQFRQFIRICKNRYHTICIWEIWNGILRDALERYGFRPETEIQGNGETVEGMRWDKSS